MSHYDVMQVCIKNGHQITDRYNTAPNHRQQFCDKCGSETTSECKNCKEKIRGYYEVEGVIDLTGRRTEVPLYCHKCGKPYPWKNVLFVRNMGKFLTSPLKYIIDSVVGVFKK